MVIIADQIIAARPTGKSQQPEQAKHGERASMP
jgi:hypothetical protein